MGGIDKSDQITDQYASELETVQCWRKVVFHLIARTSSNAYICYLENRDVTGKRMTYMCKETLSILTYAKSTITYNLKRVPLVLFITSKRLILN